MPGPKRTPLNRSPRIVISRRAVALYLRMRRCKCDRSPDCHGCRCAGCKKWWGLHDELHRELGLKPWQWPAIVPPTYYPDGTAMVPRVPSERMAVMEARLREAVKVAAAA
jgi:hypothetical protein